MIETAAIVMRPRAAGEDAVLVERTRKVAIGCLADRALVAAITAELNQLAPGRYRFDEYGWSDVFAELVDTIRQDHPTTADKGPYIAFFENVESLVATLRGKEAPPELLNAYDAKDRFWLPGDNFSDLAADAAVWKNRLNDPSFGFAWIETSATRCSEEDRGEQKCQAAQQAPHRELQISENSRSLGARDTLVACLTA